ncbi:epoxide hydrolase 1-like [Physella acuta]|uniref:epoxide hydrolase 1-like n=1 Tax=Physella acuta TaxID=109671 RepID=UPI0027DD0181|nr:epoxide hydrolase 1-like [Physella acuta]
MRGYGESGRPTGVDAYVMDKLTSDLEQIIIALGYQKCILVAHDWGGIVAWPFAHSRHEMVDRLIVLNAPALPVFQKVLKKSREQLNMSWYMFFFQLPRLPELWMKVSNFEVLDCMFTGKRSRVVGLSVKYQSPRPLTKEELGAYKYTFSKPGVVHAAINYYRASMQRARQLYDMDFQVPVLLIWGCQDEALSEAIADETEKQNPKITVKRIAEAGHFVHMDTPERVIEIMREWLGG